MRIVPPLEEISLTGMMRAVVLKRDDPLMEGRVGVRIPKVMTETDASDMEVCGMDINPKNPSDYDPNSEITPIREVKTTNMLWARPVLPFSPASEDGKLMSSGTFAVPTVGQAVYVFFEEGDVQKLRYYPFTPSLAGESIPMASLPEDSRQSLEDPERRPNLRVLAETPRGHIMAFDENEDSDYFVIRFANGHELRMKGAEDDSRIEIRTANGNAVQLDDLEDNLNITVLNDAVVNVGNDASISVANNMTAEAGGDMALKAGGGMMLEAGGDMALKASRIDLN